MGRVCSMNAGDEEHIQGFDGKGEKKGGHW
jgi:hypothetical protein